MTREEFASFVAQTIEEVICLAEEKSSRKLSRHIVFHWLGRSSPYVTENIVEHLVQRVFVDEDHMYPCVDIGVGDLLEDGSPLIVASVAGYPPRQFGKNWTGREGPFVHIVGQPFLDRVAGKKPNWSPGRIFGFITPDIKNLPES